MTVKQAYRLFQRNGVYYLQHSESGRQTSLKTKDEREAQRLLDARNQASIEPRLNLALGKAYLSAIDPLMATRNWRDVFTYYVERGGDTTRERWARVMRSRPFVGLLDKVIVETTANHFHAVLRAGGNFTNHSLRQLQNTACGFGWLHWPIIPAKLWPKPIKATARAITAEEHAKILAVEKNEERRRYYRFLWETGASQSDAANMTAEAVDWTTRILGFRRLKTGSETYIRIGGTLEQLLKELPSEGFLFPATARIDNKARAAEFCRRLRTIKVSGVSLHSYRYAWAEKARAAGYPERFAQAALGHKSRAVHQAYARNAKVICPSLEDWKNEQEKIVRLQQDGPGNRATFA